MSSPNPTWKPGDKIDSPVEQMVSLVPEELEQIDRYKLLIGSVVPRPIAFVSTIDSDGVGNLAPFSFYNGISSSPVCITFSIGHKSEKDRKDTLRNIEGNGEFVVNSVNEWFVEAMVYTAGAFPSGVDEMQKVGLTPIESKVVKPMRVKEAAVQFECKLYKSVEIGDGGKGSATLIIGEVVMVHVAEQAYQDGKISFDFIKPVARLGGFGYGHIGTTYQIQAPKV